MTAAKKRVAVVGSDSVITIRKCLDRRHFWKAVRRNVAAEASRSPSPSNEKWWEAIDRGPTPDQALMLAETLESLVRRFDPRHREIAVLYFNGFSYAEIAERCRCSDRTVGRVIARFREALREALEVEAENRSDLANAIGLGATGEKALPRRTIRELAVEFLKHPDEWLDHPNPQFGGRTPNEMVAAGEEDKVYNLFYCYEHGLF